MKSKHKLRFSKRFLSILLVIHHFNIHAIIFQNSDKIGGKIQETEFDSYKRVVVIHFSFEHQDLKIMMMCIISMTF